MDSIVRLITDMITDRQTQIGILAEVEGLETDLQIKTVITNVWP